MKKCVLIYNPESGKRRKKLKIESYKKYPLTSRNEKDIPFNLFVVWKCKTIQNVKFIVGTSDNHLIELTFNGDEDELYIDVYKKERKVTIRQKY